MCGIIGFTGDKGNIDLMADIIRHRGPDDTGFYKNGYINLGNVRLAIIDLEKGKQPIWNEAGDVVVVFNGEIFNYKELRAELKKAGHKFKTNSDTEVLAHLYEDEGIQFVERLNGMFAFALWDKKNKHLFLARDSSGIKPLYYTLRDNELYFASEIKALLTNHSEVNIDILPHFFFYRYIPDNRTFFKGIYKLMAGEVLDMGENGLNLTRFKPKPYQVPINLIDGLKKAVSAWTISDVPIGIYLSGGIDSSVVAALAVQDGINLTSFTVDWEQDSELEYARKLAKHLGICNYAVRFSQQDVIDALPDIIWHYDEPCGDAAVVPTYFIGKEASRTLKVVLAGEGGDEQFAGYEKYKRIRCIEDCMREMCVFNPDELNLLLKDFNKNDFVKEVKGLIGDNYNNLNDLLAFDRQTMLAENYLMKADKMSMAHSLEERTPLLDINLLDFTSKLTPRDKIRNGVEKYAFRQAVKGLLPDEFVNRKKQGYNTPTSYWFKGKIGNFFKSRMETSEAFQKYFNLDYIQKVFEEGRGAKLWCLLVFDLWYNMFIDKNGGKLN